jgi:hypothetical protein
MSIQTLFSPNGFNIDCNNLSVAGTLTTANGPIGEHQSLVLQYTGPWAQPQFGTVHLSKNGNAINITFDQLLAVASIGAEITSNAIPQDFWPVTGDAIAQPIIVENNTAVASGTAILSNTGVLQVAVNFNNNFTNSGTAGFFTFGMAFSQ